VFPAQTPPDIVVARPRLKRPDIAQASPASSCHRRPPLRLLLAACLLLVTGVAATCPVDGSWGPYAPGSTSAGVDQATLQAVEQARQLYGVQIVLEGQTWDPLSLQAVLDALGRLPSHVVRDLGSSFYGRLYVLANRDARTLSGQVLYPGAANFYSNNEGRNELVLVPDQGTRTVLHELGHAYQMRLAPPGRYAWVFFQQEMRDFMQATGWRLLSTDAEVAAAHDQTELRFAYDGPQVWSYLSFPDPLEDYANSFALFFYDPAELAKLSPVRYDWFLRHVATDIR
jgi:hypothetical protein